MWSLTKEMGTTTSWRTCGYSVVTGVVCAYRRGKRAAVGAHPPIRQLRDECVRVRQHPLDRPNPALVREVVPIGVPHRPEPSHDQPHRRLGLPLVRVGELLDVLGGQAVR
jgi:hypothetical protein